MFLSEKRHKYKGKSLLILFISIFFSANVSALPLIGRDKNLAVYLEGRGINSRLDHNYYQSKGLNTLIKVDGKLYMVSLNQTDNIVIDLINDTKKEEFFDTGIVTYRYNSQNRGSGAVCADGREYLYITYCFHDGSIKTAKVSLKTKTVKWISTYRLLDVKYFPLDGVYHKGKLYILVCEDEKSFHLVKIDCANGEARKIAEIKDGYVLNALSVCDEKLCVYGARMWNMHMYKARYNFEGKRVDADIYDSGEWRGAITRAFVKGKQDYVLYKQNKNLSSRKNKIIKFNGYKAPWHRNIFYDTNSLYAAGVGVYVGYGWENRSGYCKYDEKGALIQDRFIIMPRKVSQNNAVLEDGEKVCVLSSLDNGGAVLHFIPYSQAVYVYTNEKEADFKDSVVHPRISLNESGTFTYKIKYVNYENKAPNAGFPKLHIFKRGQNISGSPFMMREEDVNDKNYTDGKIYKYALDLTFAQGEEYSYRIEAACGSETFESETYYYPVFGSVPKILPFDGQNCIFPDIRKYDTTQLEAKVKFMEPNGYKIKAGYPVISIYSQDNTAVIKNVKMSEAEGKSGELKAFLRPLGAYKGGKYRYKIEAENELGAAAEALEGEFEILNSEQSGVKKEKVFNVPNPFSPHEGPTRIVFSCERAEKVKIKIFTLYGDLVYEDSFDAAKGTNEYEYGGRDGAGRILYNGIYICQLEKSNGKKLRCKILVIK